jgi:hypothetical protein
VNFPRNRLKIYSHETMNLFDYEFMWIDLPKGLQPGLKKASELS